MREVGHDFWLTEHHLWLLKDQKAFFILSTILFIFCIFLKFFIIKKKKSFTFFSNYKGIHAMSPQGLASLIDSGEQRDPDEVMSRNNILVAA